MISLRGTAFAERRLGGGYRYYRIIFNTVALATFLPIVLFEHRIDDPLLFGWPWPWSMARLALLAAAVLLFVLGGRRYDLPTFLGLRQIRRVSAPKSLAGGEGLDTSGILGRIRHPWYTGAMLVIWARPLDAAALVVNVILTVYLVVGTYLEERKLVAEFGEVYREYQRRVGMFLPLKRVRRGVPPNAARLFAAALILASTTAALADEPAPLQTVEWVDLERYAGKWYEIASYPAWFQRNCTATTAEYQAIRDSITTVGYDPSKLRRTVQVGTDRIRQVRCSSTRCRFETRSMQGC
jgi:protein-S-isoprenylcysteine O-methyltransferase Ste14